MQIRTGRTRLIVAFSFVRLFRIPGEYANKRYHERCNASGYRRPCLQVYFLHHERSAHSDEDKAAKDGDRCCSWMFHFIILFLKYLYTSLLARPASPPIKPKTTVAIPLNITSKKGLLSIISQVFAPAVINPPTKAM